MWLIELFRAVEQALGKREIIAEDLGYMSDTSGPVSWCGTAVARMKVFGICL